MAERCVATVDGTRWPLSPTQADNAALIAGVGLRRELPARAVTIALATAMQESTLNNIAYGDRDSLGLFQQRPSQGWGTIEQVQDPVYAVGTFYDHLVQVPGYRDPPRRGGRAGGPALRVPGRVRAARGHRARWSSALTGYSPAAITCTLHDAAPTTPTPSSRASSATSETCPCRSRPPTAARPSRFPHLRGHAPSTTPDSATGRSPSRAVAAAQPWG